MTAVRLLGLILCVLIQACVSRTPPVYQPLASSSFPHAGYASHEIDSDTHLVIYSINGHAFEDPIENKSLLEWAHDYVLVRAAEIAQQKGARRFQILHRDDWRIVYWAHGYRTTRPVILPGAAIVVRIVPVSLSETLPDSHDAGDVLRTFPIKSNHRFEPIQRLLTRWKTAVPPWRPMPLTSDGLNISRYHPETKVTKTASGRFEIERWWDHSMSQIGFLGECVKVAEREGAEVFALYGWEDEEYHGRQSIWFLTRATIVLNPGASDVPMAVFRVEQIKSNVDTDMLKRRQLEERNKIIDRDLESGLIY